MRPALELAFEEGESTPTTEVRVRLSAGPRHVGTVFFRSRSVPLKASGDVLFCMGLLPAMELGCTLRVAEPVDRGLAANADQIQDLLCSWYPFYRRVKIEAEPCERQYRSSRGCGLFFSGGVDSAYSLAEARSRLDGLITIVGADVSVSDAEAAGRQAAMSARVADAYGLESLVVETNIREVFQPFLGWIDYHGSAMAAIRHLLADRFQTVLIASSGDETGWVCPWGSHPALDPLLGTGGARIEHHGLNHRLAKVRRIVDEPALMREVRTCTKSYHNCGVCPKCHLTMSCLSVLDAFDRAPTFPAERAGARNEFHVVDDATRSDMVQLRAAAAATERHGQLVEDIDKALRRYDRAGSRRRLLRLPDISRRLKRAKRQARYWRASR